MSMSQPMPQPIYVAYTSSGTTLADWQTALAEKDSRIRLVDASDSEALAKASVLMAWNPPPDLIAGLASMPEMKGVISLGQGVDHILKYGNYPPGLPLVRLVDPYMAEAMAEWVLLAILKWHRDDGAYMAAAQRRDWLKLPPKMAAHTTIAIMGLGAIGGHVGQVLAGLGFRVMGWSQKPKTLPSITSTTGEVGFQQCLAEADYIVSLLPLTPATRGLFSKAAFQQMKAGCYFINGGRGDSVDEAALLAAVKSGRIQGACLDVFATEPLPKTHPFWQEPRIIIWPHVSAQTNPLTASDQVCAAIQALSGGQKPKNLVDISKGY